MNTINNKSLNKTPLGKLGQELKTIGLVTLYFGIWLAALLTIKRLILEEYQIQVSDMSMALVGALVMSKVVLVLEHVSLGRWVRNQPAWVDVLLRTAFYILGVVFVLLLEKSFEGRHEYGSFASSLSAVFQHDNIYHVWVNAICLTGALLSYNLVAVVRRHLGAGGLARLFLSFPSAEKR